MHTSDIFQFLQVNNEKIDSVSEYNYLGLIIDEKLNWSSHVTKVANKIAPYIGILKRLRHYIDIKTLMLIYYSYVDSHLIYVLPVWGSAPKTYMNTLKVLQNKSLKTINFKSTLTPTKDLYSPALLSFSQKTMYESIFYIYKIKNSLIKCNYDLITNVVISTRTTRTAGNLRLPCFKKALAQNSIYYKGLEMYNKIPSHIKETKEVAKFKLELKQYIFKHYAN